MLFLCDNCLQKGECVRVRVCVCTLSPLGWVAPKDFGSTEEHCTSLSGQQGAVDVARIDRVTQMTW